MHQLQVLLTPSIILLNNYKGPSSDLVNMYILITKFNIYRAKVQNTIPKFNGVILDVNKVQSIEKYIAIKNGKLSKYDIRWDVRL